MLRRRFSCLFVTAASIAVLSAGGSARSERAPEFVAFSLKQAERAVAAGRAQSTEVSELGGMTDLIGWVYDAKNADHVLVGIARQGQEKLSLDHFVAALRAVLDRRQFPEVSIDPPEPGGPPGKQPVNFRGGIKDTALGLAMYQADVHLKHLALSKISGQVWNVPSYLQLSADYAAGAGKLADVRSKFYFEGGVTAIDGGASDGVVTIHHLSAQVKAEVVQGLPGESDEAGTRFAVALSGGLPDLALQYPALARVVPIMKMVAVARVLGEAAATEPLTYWRQTYRLPVVPTPPTHDLETTSREVPSLSKEVVLQGGIATGTTLLRLQNGDALAFRDVVVRSRPSAQALSWAPPLDRWDIAGDVNYGAALDRAGAADRDDGCNVHRTLTDLPGGAAPANGAGAWPRPLPGDSRPSAHPDLASIPLPPPPARPAVTAPRPPGWAGVGGVMLSDMAAVRGAPNAAAGILGNGRFSLVLDDRAVAAEPLAFRRFVTALWAVYFGDTDPGISIDPISHGNAKQLVRYVGDVTNSDLGRVMREADYLMKQWAVGARRPALAGFENPDDLAARRRTLFLNAMSRFWFVPQEMTFAATSDALLFESGRMAVKTEFLALNSRGLRADPANEDFAAYLTANYENLARLHPVLRELAEYAKLVSLAKYLKQSGAPLYWFLLANKDLVLTEQSPGTVDAILADSAHFAGVRVEGGVELASKENYVLDSAARAAIESAAASLSPGAWLKTGSRPPSSSFPKTASFDLGKKAYSIVPQRSTSSGEDYRGNRYQTDVSIHLDGFALTKDKLADLLPALRRQEVWDALRPLVERLSDRDVQARFKGLYEEAAAKAAGRAEAVVSRLAVLIGKDYRDSAAFTRDLVYAIGKDDCERVAPTVLKYAQYRTDMDVVRYLKPEASGEPGEFGRGWHLLLPYRITPHGAEKKQFQTVAVPAEMQVLNLVTGRSDVLFFRTDRAEGVGYFPAATEQAALSSLLLLSDASFLLTDKIGCRFELDQSGRLKSMRYAAGHVVKLSYPDGLFKGFDADPYEVRPLPADGERIEFRGASVPRRVAVVDMHGRSEQLRFGSTGNIVGYVPEDRESRFELLALLSDGSFQLRDKHGNETRFDGRGNFAGMILPVLSQPVSAMEMGSHRVVFRFAIDRLGHLIIDSAWILPIEPGSKPLYVVSYKYDDAGGLARVALETPEGKPVLAATHAEHGVDHRLVAR